MVLGSTVTAALSFLCRLLLRCWIFWLFLHGRSVLTFLHDFLFRLILLLLSSSLCFCLSFWFGFFRPLRLRLGILLCRSLWFGLAFCFSLGLLAAARGLDLRLQLLNFLLLLWMRCFLTICIDPLRRLISFFLLRCSPRALLFFSLLLGWILLLLLSFIFFMFIFFIIFIVFIFTSVLLIFLLPTIAFVLPSSLNGVFEGLPFMFRDHGSDGYDKACKILTLIMVGSRV